MLQNEVLKIFLSDSEIKEKYEITDEKIKSVSMTNPESNLMIMVIRELIIKQKDAPSINIAAAQLNTLLDNRLK